MCRGPAARRATVGGDEAADTRDGAGAESAGDRDRAFVLRGEGAGVLADVVEDAARGADGHVGHRVVAAGLWVAWPTVIVPDVDGQPEAVETGAKVSARRRHANRRGITHAGNGQGSAVTGQGSGSAGASVNP